MLEAYYCGSSQSPVDWMKTKAMLSRPPITVGGLDVMGKQPGNPLCSSSTVCDGNDREAVDKSMTGQMPPLLCTHRVQLRAIHMHQHQDALLQTIHRPEAVVPQNCLHPHESQDKRAAGFGLSYLVCTLY